MAEVVTLYPTCSFQIDGNVRIFRPGRDSASQLILNRSLGRKGRVASAETAALDRADKTVIDYIDRHDDLLHRQAPSRLGACRP